MLKRIAALFGVDAPAAPVLGGNYSRSPGIDPRFLAAHPEWAGWHKGMPIPRPPGARPAPPLPPSARAYHSAVPSGAPAAPHVDMTLANLATAAQQAPALASGIASGISQAGSLLSSFTAPSSPTADLNVSTSDATAFGGESIETEDWSAPSQVEYHLPRTDAFGPSHSPYNFGGEFGDSQRIDTEGLPDGPIGTGSGSFGFDDGYPAWVPGVPGGYPAGDFDNSDKVGCDFGFEDEFYVIGGPSLLFGVEDDDLGCKG